MKKISCLASVAFVPTTIWVSVYFLERRNLRNTSHENRTSTFWHANYSVDMVVVVVVFVPLVSALAYYMWTLHRELLSKQCDQIGRFFKYTSNKFSTKSCSNIWRLSGLFRKMWFFNLKLQSILFGQLLEKFGYFQF